MAFPIDSTKGLGERKKLNGAQNCLFQRTCLAKFFMPATSHEPISGQLQQPSSNVNKRPPPSVQDPLRKIFLFWNFAPSRFSLPALSRHPREPPGNVRIKQHGRSRVPLQHTKATRGGPAICSSPSQSVPLSPARRRLCGSGGGGGGSSSKTARATGSKAATNLQPAAFYLPRYAWGFADCSATAHCLLLLLVEPWPIPSHHHAHHAHHHHQDANLACRCRTRTRGEARNSALPEAGFIGSSSRQQLNGKSLAIGGCRSVSCRRPSKPSLPIIVGSATPGIATHRRRRTAGRPSSQPGVHRTACSAPTSRRTSARGFGQESRYRQRAFTEEARFSHCPVRPRPCWKGWPWSWRFSTQLGARLHIPPHHPESVADPAASWEAHLGETPSRCLAADRASHPRFRQFLKDRIYNLATQQHPFSPKTAGRSSNAEYTGPCIDARVREADRGDLARCRLSSNTCPACPERMHPPRRLIGRGDWQDLNRFQGHLHGPHPAPQPLQTNHGETSPHALPQLAARATRMLATPASRLCLLRGPFLGEGAAALEALSLGALGTTGQSCGR